MYMTQFETKFFWWFNGMDRWTYDMGPCLNSVANKYIVTCQAHPASVKRVQCTVRLFNFW